MKTQHTKGEWKIGKSLRCLVGTNEPEVLAIADCNIDGDINKEEQQANAKLIAAAPRTTQLLIESTKLLDQLLASGAIKYSKEISVVKLTIRINKRTIQKAI